MKTNFISNLKRYTFLVLAVLGAFVGYSQSSQNPSIGGTKTPSTDPLGDFLLNIGGSQGTPRDTSSGMILLSLENKTNCIFAYSKEIGGKGTSSDTGQFDDDDFIPYDIGGRISSDGLGFTTFDSDTGGSGSKGTNTGTGDLNPTDNDPYNIGGRGTNTGTGAFAFLTDTGGRDSGGGLLGNQNSDTGGGNGGKNTTGEFACFDIGGKDSTGGLNPLNDIGGRGGSDPGTGPFPIAFCGELDANSTNAAYFELSLAENDPIPSFIFDTGGKNGTGMSTGVDFYTYVDSQTYQWTKNSGCVLRPFFPTD